MTDNIFVEAPIQLIKFDGPKFIVNEEAINIIKSITDEIIVVSIVGKARTGKSFLMNSLLDIKQKIKGFEVSSSINSCTKGIWIWGNYRNKPNNKAKILFIDSEGTSSFDRSTKTYDSKIFALVVLISSLFIYNTFSNIDEQGISDLSLAAHLSNSIAVNTNVSLNKNNNINNNNETTESIISELSPKFIWLIRDFTLEKIHPETGEEISSKEYLELCLNKKSLGRNSSENNIIRDNIIKYFHDRDCFTLPRPIDNEDNIKNLINQPFESLNSEYKIEFMNLKNEVFKNSKIKKFKGKRLTGKSLYELINTFVDAINSGGVPNISNAWESIISNDINEAYEKAYLNLKTNEKKSVVQFLGSVSKNSLNVMNSSISNSNSYKEYSIYEYLLNITKIAKDSMLIFKHIGLSNKESINLNRNCRILYGNKYTKIKDEIKQFIKRSDDAYSTCFNSMLFGIFDSISKEMMNKANCRSYNDKNHYDLIEDEDKFCSDIKNIYGNMRCLSVFIKKYKELTEICIYSIYHNIEIAIGNKISSNKKEIEAIKFDVEINEDKVRGYKDKLESINNRISNKEKDKSLNNNEINLYSDKIKNLKERISILKDAKKLRKEQEEELKKRKAAQNLNNLNEINEEGIIPNKIVRHNKKENKTCGCGCFIF